MLHPHPDLLRILDANANRAREALRVLEDYARFSLNSDPLTSALKRLRHDLAAALALLPMDHALLHRDTENDVGTSIKTEAELTRPNPSAVLNANAKRLSEALRSMEESAKVLNTNAAQLLEKLRYRGYTLEQFLHQSLQSLSATDRFRHVRLYILLTESLCHPSVGGWEATLDAILAAVPGGGDKPSPLAIQLREKSLPDNELLRRATLVSDKCHAARGGGALHLLNDRPDIALLSNADGLHLGQTDLPAPAARQLLGPSAILGISTENLDQARQALDAGATYLATGPMFPTTTKLKPRLATPTYAEQALKTFPNTPIVAIGGITPENLPQLTQVGVQCVAVSSAILSSPNPAQVVQHFLSLLPP